LAPVITDFIRNTKRKLYDEKLEDVLEMLDLEWSKDDDTKTQCNRLNTSSLHPGNVFNKNCPAQVKRRMQWEAPSKPLAVDDPLLLPEREVHAEIGINSFLDREIPKGGYVRILAESLLWEERLGKTSIRTTEGLTIYMEPHRGWHYIHGAAQRVDNCTQQLEFLRKRWLDREQELITVIPEKTQRTEEKEEAGKLGLDHQRGQYYEHCKRSTKPRALRRGCNVSPPLLSIGGGTRRPKVLGRG